MAEKKVALQTKTDEVKRQNFASLEELKELKPRLRMRKGSCRRQRNSTTSSWRRRQETEDADADPEQITAEKLMVIMSSAGVRATSDQVKDLALKLSEKAVKRRTCG